MSPKRVQWDHAVTLQALGIHGVTSEPPLHTQGSHADIYEDPTDPTRLIKVTNDPEDATNLVAAQALSNSNVIKCYGWTTTGVINGTALLVGFVQGALAPYTSPEFLGLLEGHLGSEPRSQAHIRILQPDAFRSGILHKHGRNNPAELKKLSALFQTLNFLDSKLSIFLADLADNVIDTGQDYVIVDFGRRTAEPAS